MSRKEPWILSDEEIILMLKRKMALTVLVATGIMICLPVNSYTATSSKMKMYKPDGGWVGGYYANWSYWRGRPSIKSLDKIRDKAGAANFVIYAFLGITTSQTLAEDKPYYGGSRLTSVQQGKPGTLVDPEALLENRTNSCPAYPQDFSACATANVYPYLQSYADASKKTILMASVGGWSYTPRFTGFYQDYRKNPLVLTRFLDSAENWLRGHPQYKGIDIDWEFPGVGHDGSSDHAGEGRLYALIIKKLRRRLNKLGREKNTYYYLTTAVVASPAIAGKEAMEGVNWEKVAKKVNWFNLMAFDINGEFNAAGDDPRALSMDNPVDIDAAIQYYRGVGVPSRKIILGLPAYAREMLVARQPGQPGKYGYGGNLHYKSYQNFFNAFRKTYYQDYPDYFDFQDVPNNQPYYPLGGMIDFTGSYDYACFLSILTGGKASSDCPVLTSMDNRGNLGQLPPVDLHLSEPVPGVAWLSGTRQNVRANFKRSPASFYPAYPVFSIDTQRAVHYKIKNLVRKNKLGGVWFWELSQDALNDPAYALFTTACKDLGKGGKCLRVKKPEPGTGVKPGLCRGEMNCLELSNNSYARYSYTVTDGKGRRYDFSDMRGACNDDPLCVRHVSLGSSVTTFTINPTGASKCRGKTHREDSIMCDVNTLTCSCHPS